MKKEKTVTMTWAIPNFPRALQNQFKALCALHGEDMKDTLIKIVKREIRERAGGQK